MAVASHQPLFGLVLVGILAGVAAVFLDSLSNLHCAALQ